MPSPVRTAPLILGGVRIPAYDLLVIAVTAVAMVALTLFLQRTKRGAAMQAVAMDHEAATAAGIHVGPQQRDRVRHRRRRWPRWPAALVGPMLYVSPTMGDSLGIQGFAAAILGGFGSIPGAIVGGLGIGVIGSFAAQSFQGYSDLVTFVVFTVLVMIRPTGIFGEKTVNRA